MLFFTVSSLITILSGSASFFSLVSSTGVGTGYSTCLPLLLVIIAFTSSILGAGSPEEAISWTPLGLGRVWERNLPFSYTCSWLVNMEIEHCRLSNFLAISD